MRKFRAERSSASKLPAIALPPYAGEQDQDHAMGAGFNAHVPKPISSCDRPDYGWERFLVERTVGWGISCR
jgi:CheY-like chemotaxis protein